MKKILIVVAKFGDFSIYGLCFAISATFSILGIRGLKDLFKM